MYTNARTHSLTHSRWLHQMRMLLSCQHRRRHRRHRGSSHRRPCLWTAPVSSMQRTSCCAAEEHSLRRLHDDYDRLTVSPPDANVPPAMSDDSTQSSPVHRRYISVSLALSRPRLSIVRCSQLPKLPGPLTAPLPITGESVRIPSACPAGRRLGAVTREART